MGQDFHDPAWLRQEQDLLRRAKRGEREALGELYRVFSGPLYRSVLLPRLGDAQTAEDALAETFTAAFGKLGEYEPRGKSLWGWLCRIAANKATDQHRGRTRGGKALSSYESLLEPLVGATGDAEDQLIRQLDQSALQQRVRQTLAAINPRYARALQLRFLEGRSRSESATALQVKQGTFDVVLLRSLRAFRAEWLAEQDEED